MKKQKLVALTISALGDSIIIRIFFNEPSGLMIILVLWSLTLHQLSRNSRYHCDALNICAEMQQSDHTEESDDF